MTRSATRSVRLSWRRRIAEVEASGIAPVPPVRPPIGGLLDGRVDDLYAGFDPGAGVARDALEFVERVRAHHVPRNSERRRRTADIVAELLGLVGYQVHSSLDSTIEKMFHLVLWEVKR